MVQSTPDWDVGVDLPRGLNTPSESDDWKGEATSFTNSCLRTTLQLQTARHFPIPDPKMRLDGPAVWYLAGEGLGRV